MLLDKACMSRRRLRCPTIVIRGVRNCKYTWRCQHFSFSFPVWKWKINLAAGCRWYAGEPTYIRVTWTLQAHLHAIKSILFCTYVLTCHCTTEKNQRRGRNVGNCTISSSRCLGTLTLMIGIAVLQKCKHWQLVPVLQWIRDLRLTLQKSCREKWLDRCVTEGGALTIFENRYGCRWHTRDAGEYGFDYPCTPVLITT